MIDVYILGMNMEASTRIVFHLHSRIDIVYSVGSFERGKHIKRG